ncbi:MAG: hypothetical protein KBS52_04335 [Clostridiales bacterium]|nr:hypothetical protein [Candidatus Equinaster intestinalis]
MSIKNTLKSIFFKTDKGNAIMPESDVNQVFLAGTVVYKYAPPNGKCTILTIKSFDGEKANFPHIVCYQKNKATADKISVGDYVSIRGNVQSSILKDGTARTSVICNEIYHKPENKKMFGEIIYLNRMNIFGDVVNIKQITPNLTEFTVKTHVDGRTSIFPVDFYSAAAGDINIGDKVMINGNVQTVKKTNSFGTISHYENYVAFKIQNWTHQNGDLEIGA